MVDDPTAAVSGGQPSRWLRSRPAPVVGAAFIAGGVAVLAANDPSAAGSRFPACVVRTWTGLWCPGCGLTRAGHELLHGDIVAALGYNLFVPVAAVGIALAWWAWCSSAWGLTFLPVRVRALVGDPGSARRRRSDGALWAMFWALIAYGVLRNIPVEPFTALAP